MRQFFFIWRSPLHSAFNCNMDVFHKSAEGGRLTKTLTDVKKNAGMKFVKFTVSSGTPKYETSGSMPAASNNFALISTFTILYWSIYSLMEVAAASRLFPPKAAL